MALLSVAPPPRCGVPHAGPVRRLMAAETEDYGVKPNAWNALVRRARIGLKRKAVALTLSSYASPNGGDVKCGVARLAADCEVSYSTARRYLAWLRDVGLIELVRPGNRKAKRADGYRLIIAPEAYKHLDIPDDVEYRQLVEGVNESNRAGEKARRLRSPIESAEATDSEDSSALIMVSAEPSHLRSFSTPSALILGDPLPTITTDQVRAPTTGGAPPPDPRRPQPPTASGSGTWNTTSLAVALAQPQDQPGDSRPHARAPAPIVELFPGVTGEAPYRPTANTARRWHHPAQQAIEEASARRRAAEAAHQARLAAGTEVS